MLRLRAQIAGLYYGWVIALVLALTQLTSWGVLYYAFAVVLTPLEQEQGWSRAQTTGAFSLALLLSGIAAIPAGRWIDRHGPRGLMTCGSLAAALLVWAWSHVGNLASFYLVWAGIGIAMAAVLYEPAFATVSTWFHQRRRQALTLVTIFGGLASVVFMPLTQQLVEGQGWRSAVATLALILAVVTIPLHGLLLRRAPRPGGRPIGLPQRAEPLEAGPAPGAAASLEPRAALRETSYWALLSAFSLSAFVAVAASVHLLPFLIQQGYPASTAATLAGLMGAMQLPGRLLFAPLGGWLSRRLLSSLVFVLQGLALLLLLGQPGTSRLLVFVVLFGMANGMATLLRPVLIAELFGTAFFGSLSGPVSLATTSARALAPIAVGLLYTAWGGYQPVFWLLVALAVGAALCAWLLEQPQR